MHEKILTGMAKTTKKPFLFSIDLEDVRQNIKKGETYRERVPENTYSYLSWLTKYQAKCTFFVTGHIAQTYPSLIRDIIQEGHEIACHSNAHIPIDQLTKDAFKSDLTKNTELLVKAGAYSIAGFRAPMFSIIPETAWAYEILASLGFRYSSSVLPARNPLYGWKGFGLEPRLMNEHVVEIPISVGSFGMLRLPPFGGVYFRVLPLFLIKRKINQLKKTELPLVGYFHPYDIDTGQERFMHPGLNKNPFFNFLMYYNRSRVFEKLDDLLRNELYVCTYKSYIEQFPR